MKKMISTLLLALSCHLARADSEYRTVTHASAPVSQNMSLSLATDDRWLEGHTFSEQKVGLSGPSLAVGIGRQRILKNEDSFGYLSLKASHRLQNYSLFGVLTAERYLSSQKSLFKPFAKVSRPLFQGCVAPYVFGLGIFHHDGEALEYRAGGGLSVPLSSQCSLSVEAAHRSLQGEDRALFTAGLTMKF